MKPPSDTAAAIAAGSGPLRVEQVEVEGVRLRVGIRPGRGRPLLLFNGIGANLDILRPLVEALDDVEIVVFDMPGAGGSPATWLPRRMPALARLTARLLDTLGYDGAVDVLGLSWGGAMAQQFAISFPARTNRLVLAATSAGLLSLPPATSALLRMLTPARYGSSRYMERVAPDLYGGLARRRPDLVARYAALIRAPSQRGYLYQMQAIMGWTSAHKLHRLRCPTLVMGGDDDPLIPLVNMRLLYWLIPKSYLHVIRGGGHLFLLLRANECAAVLRRFLTERRYDGTDPQDWWLARGVRPPYGEPANQRHDVPGDGSPRADTLAL